ncbi:MAG: aldehyde dehydrogenase family protein [Bacteroidota bacterium]
MAKTKSTSRKKAAASNGAATNGQASSPRLNVLKTYKMYIGGKFPRTESGRFYSLQKGKGVAIANNFRGSRKYFRNSVVAARKAQPGWAGRAALNRGQILYRIAEMLEGRRTQFVAELVEQGVAQAAAEQEVNVAIDRMVYYAGWCDKYQQIFSSVNSVASSHFNFSILEPMGVISAFAPESFGLAGLVSVIAPVIAGGNTIVVLAAEQFPLTAITFAEVLNSSDVPGGVVNILTGHRSELLGHFSTHMDVNGMVYTGEDKDALKEIHQNATQNVKRVRQYHHEDWQDDAAQGPYRILDVQETKTTWHPIAQSMGGGGKY